VYPEGILLRMFMVFAVCVMLAMELPAQAAGRSPGKRKLGQEPEGKQQAISAAPARSASNSLVTVPLIPPVSHNKVTAIDSLPRRLQLYFADDKPDRWIDEHEARELRGKGLVEYLWTKKRVRGVRWVEALERGSRLREDVRWSAKSARNRLKNTHYSHNSETDDNPRGVWALNHIYDASRKAA